MTRKRQRTWNTFNICHIFWNPDDSLIPNMMIDTSPWSSCSRRSPWSPWSPCSSHTFSSTGPSVSPFRDFSFLTPKQGCFHRGLVKIAQIEGAEGGWGRLRMAERRWGELRGAKGAEGSEGELRVAEMPEICLRYAQDINKICPRYAWDMPKICPRYAQYMPQICQGYPPDMAKICPAIL